MKTTPLIALMPALMYTARFLNFFMHPGDDTSYNGGEIAQLEDENLEDEELPDEAPAPSHDAFSYTETDSKTPPEKEDSEIEANDLDEK